MPAPVPPPADLYLDLLAGCLTRDLFLDEEVRNVDLRDWPGGEPDGLRDTLRERRRRVVQTGADRATRALGNDWPPHAETMVGLARLANVRRCVTIALAGGVPGDLVETGVWRVKATLARYGLLDDQVRFVPGWFRDTLPKRATEIGPIAVLRLDGDMYESTIDALTHLEPLVAPGGFVIIDDYHGIEACRQAVTDHRSAHGITAPLHEIDWTAVWWRKPR